MNKYNPKFLRTPDFQLNKCSNKPIDARFPTEVE